MKTTRIAALILSLALLGALCGCVTAPAVSEPVRPRPFREGIFGRKAPKSRPA